MALNGETFYDDVMTLCAQDETFYYKDTRLHAVHYRIFNCHLCSYGRFQTCTAALNCCGTMFNITDPNHVRLVSLPFEKFFDYEEGFGRKQFHERGQLGDKMEKMDGSLVSTFLHGRSSKEQILRLKSKQSLTSNQVLEAMQLLTDDFKSEMERLVSLNYTVNMEYTSPSNRVFTSYSQAKLTVLAIRSHMDGQTLFGTRLKHFLLDHQFPTILDHLVPFERVPSNVTHAQLLQDVYQQTHGEGYVVEIIHSDQPSYLVKVKTKKYGLSYGDKGTLDSPRSVFEAIIINEQTENLRALFQNDPEALQRIEEMETKIRPEYNQMVRSIEDFYHANKHRSKKDFLQLVKANEKMKIYLILLMRLYNGEENDYKGFAMKHAKDLFGIRSQ